MKEYRYASESPVWRLGLLLESARERQPSGWLLAWCKDGVLDAVLESPDGEQRPVSPWCYSAAAESAEAGVPISVMDCQGVSAITDDAAAELLPMCGPVEVW